MRFNTRFTRRTGAVGLALIAILAATASSCEDRAATPSSMCAVIRGNGKSSDGSSHSGDRKVQKVVWPNQNPSYDTDSHEAWYFPCNSRNFIVNDGQQVNANDKKVGDRHTPVVGYVKGGARVNGFLSAYWTLNQSEEALRQFWELCDKYVCATKDAQSGDANFSSPGWNGMLSENFSTALDDAFFRVVAEYGDDVWQQPNAERYKQVGDRMSDIFAEVIRGKTGFNTDIFCGSGNSGWENPDKPGEGKFTCTKVRVEIDNIFAADQELRQGNEDKQQSDQQRQANASRLADAQALYGPDGGYWLGAQDLVDRCKAASVPCTVNVGNPPNAAGR